MKRIQRPLESLVRRVAWPAVSGGLALLVMALLVGGAHAGSHEAHPPNIILIIGDGMDDQQITIARNYLVGANGRMTLDSLPVRSTAQVLTVEENDPSLAVYVADSANSATSIASGITTSRGRIGTSAGSDEDVITVLELAEQKGMKTGLVATSGVATNGMGIFLKDFGANSDKNEISIIE